MEPQNPRDFLSEIFKMIEKANPALAATTTEDEFCAELIDLFE